MRIGSPSLSVQQGRHVLSADVALGTNDVVVPESLGFSIDGDESFFLPDVTDAFVVGLVASAMYLGEDISVGGKVSTRLAHGIDTYQ